MGAKLSRFYDFLMHHQRRGTRFTLRGAADATGYEISSLKTYLSKHLKGRWVDAADGTHFEVHDFANVSRAAFAEAMSQNTRLTFEDEEEWRAHVQRLLALGIRNRYPVRRAVQEILQDLEVPRT